MATVLWQPGCHGNNNQEPTNSIFLNKICQLTVEDFKLIT